MQYISIDQIPGATSPYPKGTVFTQQPDLTYLPAGSTEVFSQLSVEGDSNLFTQYNPTAPWKPADGDTVFAPDQFMQVNQETYSAGNHRQDTLYGAGYLRPDAASLQQVITNGAASVPMPIQSQILPK